MFIQYYCILQENTACSIIAAICTEYSASDKSTNVGLIWEQHVKCKRQFEVIVKLLDAFVSSEAANTQNSSSQRRTNHDKIRSTHDKIRIKFGVLVA